jgi:hypothetical protein
MTAPFVRADEAALVAYSRAQSNGAAHETALNIAASVWFCQCPWVDGGWARLRVTRLLGERSAPRPA